jgi:hypothetical protein
MISKQLMDLRTGAILSGCVAALICLFALFGLIDRDPIIADGRENLVAASNLLRHGVFSSALQLAPPSDMKREPAWPALTASLLLASRLQEVEPETLATEHYALFKRLSAALLALVAGLASGLTWGWARRPALAWSVAVALALTTLTTMPRLVNRFNNEPLAMLLLLAASALALAVCRGTWRSGIGLGMALGLLALTKAQFLFIAGVPIVAVGFFSRKATRTLLAFALVVAPWIVRNALLFGEPWISQRGKTVAAVRLIMVSESREQERACMAFAFTHPGWRDQVGRIVGIGLQDFKQGARCERFNREICFDMGMERVGCEPFPEDTAAITSGVDWRGAVQYFYRGMAAGREIEAGRLNLTDLAPLTWQNVERYAVTLPLFVWRGWGFSAWPWLSLLLMMALVAACFTDVWPFAITALSAHLFHILLTHNIPRYHAIEIGVMVAAAAYVVDAVLDSATACARTLRKARTHSAVRGSVPPPRT